MIDERLLSLYILSKEKNYTKTANTLNLTQPAISHHIKSLEKEYNQKLIVKKGKNLTLTPAGEILVQYYDKFKSLDVRMNEDITNINSLNKFIDIGITLTAGEYLIPSILNIIIKSIPNISINFHTDNMEKIYKGVKNDVLDFAIIEGQFPKETSINSFLLAEDEMILVTSPSHTFKNMKKINRLLLQKERLILRERKSNTRTLIEEFLNNNGDSISRYNVMLELENINLIKELVSQNYGVSILPRSVCQQEIKKGKLIEVELEDFHIHRGIYIVYKNKCAYLNICQEIENVIASKKSFE
ncbi:MAG: LysR family transcriptional regulator [Bacilli bacterium]|nr:LysR family transcriptional regulator [Erysipelotrichaceae bacterium]MDD6250597.1 LysR family transcriptional regulator [Bacillales bacterium]MDD7382076.1 LysR family transcriptional regulator [Bacillales bacterium]MDY2745731.1 LysR family transcriptional regulator [Bacilli bacterium]MDY3890867.1 LysR family transcriptional regulator [Bacilli bacterium]